MPLAFVNRMFLMPGASGTGGMTIPHEAAAAVEALIEETTAVDQPYTESLSRLLDFFKQSMLSSLKRDYLTDPVLIETLHHLAARLSTLKRWSEHVAAPSIVQIVLEGDSNEAEQIAAGPERIGHLLLPLLLRFDGSWRGELLLRTDLFGRLRFPLCDWSVVLESPEYATAGVLADQNVVVTLDGERASWSLGDADRETFLIQLRDDCRRMIVENAASHSGAGQIVDNTRVRAVLRRAGQLGDTAVRYDPIHFPGGEEHAVLSGMLVEQVLAAIGRNSPAVYGEFCRFVKSVRGFESVGGAHGTIQSFSDPTLPGVMGINFSFTAAGEPRMSPFCFTWFGHELGHTKFYLIDAIAYAKGLSFVRNRRETTGPIARYGRPLSVRTLFQVPYVHLYEWTLLADFTEAHFSSLPWSVTEDPIAVGDELQREIEESFRLIDKHARLTAAGEAALAQFRELFERAQARWKLIRGG